MQAALDSAGDGWAPLLAYAEALVAAGRAAEAALLGADLLRRSRLAAPSPRPSDTKDASSPRPPDASLLRLLGRLAVHDPDTLCALLSPADAAAALTQAMTLAPERVELWLRQGDLLSDQRRFAAAAEAYRRALALHPAQPAIWSRLAHRLGLLGRAAEALEAADRALALAPDLIEAWHARLLALQALVRHTEAVAVAERLQALAPGFASAWWLGALSRLALGDFAQGWRDYEWRARAIPQAFTQLPFDVPLWLGETALDGRTILLHAEQGFGDTLQFCRYAPILARRGRVVLAVPPSLQRLLRSLDGDITVITEGEAIPPFDVHCPLMSLPLAFGTTLATIPADVPYLRAPADRAALWRQRMAALPGRRVGVVWAGNPRPGNVNASAIDRRRSLPPGALAPLADLDGVSFISLQVGAAPEPGVRLHDWTADLTDFAETAALIEALDLVISVDTSVVHLAGSLGRPIWVLNRFDACWRWLMDRNDSPWYPSARLFRQPTPGDWDSVLRRVAEALRGLAG